MRAVVLDAAPAPPSGLQLKTVPMPKAQLGQVLIRVKAFGLNRSELHTRHGFAGDSVTFPRILGIEAAGVVAEDAPGGEFKRDQKVVAITGGLGRTMDGGYAEYVIAPVTAVLSFQNDQKVPWRTIGAIPEMLQTSYGILTVGGDAKPGQTLFIRGGTSSIGMMLALLGKDMGMKVISTTRSKAKEGAMKAAGVDEVVIDDGKIAEKVRALVPEGVDVAVELVGANVIRDSIRTVKHHGTLVFAGMLSNDWTLKGEDTYLIELIPNGVRLTAYGGGAENLPQEVLQQVIDGVASGKHTIPVHKAYKLDEIVQAHEDMEAGGAAGKLVVVVDDS